MLIINVHTTVKRRHIEAQCILGLLLNFREDDFQEEKGCINRNIACIHVIRFKTFPVTEAAEAIMIARLETVEVVKYTTLEVWSH